MRSARGPAVRLRRAWQRQRAGIMPCLPPAAPDPIALRHGQGCSSEQARQAQGRGGRAGGTRAGARAGTRARCREEAPGGAQGEGGAEADRAPVAQQGVAACSITARPCTAPPPCSSPEHSLECARLRTGRPDRPGHRARRPPPPPPVPPPAAQPPPPARPPALPPGRGRGVCVWRRRLRAAGPGRGGDGAAAPLPAVGGWQEGAAGCAAAGCWARVLRGVWVLVQGAGPGRRRCSSVDQSTMVAPLCQHCTCYKSLHADGANHDPPTSAHLPCAALRASRCCRWPAAACTPWRSRRTARSGRGA